MKSSLARTFQYLFLLSAIPLKDFKDSSPHLSIGLKSDTQTQSTQLDPYLNFSWNSYHFFTDFTSLTAVKSFALGSDFHQALQVSANARGSFLIGYALQSHLLNPVFRASSFHIKIPLEVSFHAESLSSSWPSDRVSTRDRDLYFGFVLKTGVEFSSMDKDISSTLSVGWMPYTLYATLNNRWLMTWSVQFF
jgi:hypothetical protein